MPLNPRLHEGSGSQARRAGPEPAETHDPYNVLLDQFEAQTRLLLEHGLEPQIRARLARLLPTRGEPASRSEEKTIDGVGLAQVLAICRLMQRFKLTGDQHAAIGALKAWLVDEMRAEPARRSEQKP